MKTLKRNFIKGREDLIFTNEKRIVELYWNYFDRSLSQLQKRTNELQLFFEYGHVDVKQIQFLTITFIYLDTSKRVDTKLNLEYCIKETVKVLTPKHIRNNRFEIPFVVTIGSMELWKVSFAAKFKEAPAGLTCSISYKKK